MFLFLTLFLIKLLFLSLNFPQKTSFFVRVNFLCKKKYVFLFPRTKNMLYLRHAPNFYEIDPSSPSVNSRHRLLFGKSMEQKKKPEYQIEVRSLSQSKMEDRLRYTSCPVLKLNLIHLNICHSVKCYHCLLLIQDTFVIRCQTLLQDWSLYTTVKKIC